MGNMDTDAGSAMQAVEIGRLAGLEAIVEAVGNSSANIAVREFEKAMRNEEIKAHVKDGIISYIYAAGFLSFAGREITRESMTKVLSAIGVKPRVELIDSVLRSGVKNHIVYVYVSYYLLANGVERTEENVKKVMDAIGMEMDKEGLDEVTQAVQR
ncbi:MAG: hypothetical protein KGH69_04135 [Candidatus Micrarchaeota archaeon]|nr:hypothetical protein [Candidatus Micrarchaeota archaeon]